MIPRRDTRTRPTNKVVLDLVEKLSGERPDKKCRNHLKSGGTRQHQGQHIRYYPFDPEGISDLKINRAEEGIFLRLRLSRQAIFNPQAGVKTVHILVHALQAPIADKGPNEYESHPPAHSCRS